YVATYAGLRAVRPVPTASLNSRRLAGGRVSGHQDSVCSRLPWRHCRKASGPRHCRRASWSGWPSTVGGPWVGQATNRCARAASRFAARMARTMTSSAAGHAARAGRSVASSEMAPSGPNDQRAPMTQVEGRHTICVGAAMAAMASWGIPPRASPPWRLLHGAGSAGGAADALDQCVEFGVFGMFESHEPAPEPIVLAGQQPSEDRAFWFGGLRPVFIEPAGEQLVELAHAAARAPAEHFQFVGFIGHACPHPGPLCGPVPLPQAGEGMVSRQTW